MEDKKVWFERYEKTSAAEKVLLGFPQDGQIWAFFAGSALLEERCRITEGNGNYGLVLRLQLLKKTQKQAAIVGGQAKVVCSEEYLQKTMQDNRLNRGEAFEYIIRLQTGNANYKQGYQSPYYKEPDLYIEGVAVQVKYADATFAELKTIEDGMREKGLA